MTIPTGSFGINIDPSATGSAAALRLARLADESGLDFAGVQDHLYSEPSRRRSTSCGP